MTTILPWGVATRLRLAVIAPKMDPGEVDQRAAVVKEACSWLGTPFHDLARCKHAGVDCAQFIAGAYENAGVARNLVIDFYSPQWHLHRDSERYIDGLVANGAHEISEADAKPGDIVLFKQGRTYSHGAIVVDWPHIIIHAVKIMRGVCFSDVTRDRFLTSRDRRFFSFWK
jgi:NlpC/P60 family